MKLLSSRWSGSLDSLVTQSNYLVSTSTLLHMVSHYQKSLGQKINQAFFLHQITVYHSHQPGVNHPQTLVCRFALISKTTKLSIKSSTQRSLKGERIFFFFLFSTQQTHYSTQLIVASA